MLANGDRARSIAAHVAVAFALVGVIGCLLGLFGGLFFGYSLLYFLGPLSLIAMLPLVVYRSVPARIAFWALAAAFASSPLTPVDYFDPVLASRLAALGQYPTWLPFALLLWALPFVWCGVSMSARRAIDAGRSSALALLA